MGLRERKKLATRAALSWAAIRLIVERGYEHVLVEDIAAEAEVSPRTFNNYFSSKAEAVASRHLDRCLLIAEDLRARPAAEPLWEAITAAVLAQFVAGPEVTAHPRPDREVWAAGLRLMMSVPAVQAETLRASATAEAAVADAVGERTGTDPAADMYPKLVAAVVMAANNVASQHFSLNGAGAETGIQQLLVDALSQVSAGLPVPRV
ncbi:TetR family transcriptional regulator [Actinoplanes sp. TBRC 11911]|uniref:TetR/AcrR family transcriptional regulator n=1 Tax=Actinoplanes sp. TBRC 11911 TaxID=2729386 RepID=UPI00145FCC90|nr:TetR family transcriptional regulator [Actinoplanes sp. TBRC 11911]NMO56651.1 TetR family transcriptional regulator [Actinoplanes sp. TBRC 11911]